MIDTNHMKSFRELAQSESISDLATANDESTLNQLQEVAPSTSSNSEATAEASFTSDIRNAKTLLVLINNQLAIQRMKIQEKDTLDDNKKEWYLIASTLDRFCLLCYSVITLLGLFIIFYL